MPIKIYMPALSPTMEEGTLSSWLVKEGDEVTSGDIICEIETDKATMEVETIDEGIIGKLYIETGTDNVKVGTLIAAILEEGEDKGALEKVGSHNSTEAKVPLPETSKEIEVEVIVNVEKKDNPQNFNNGGRIKASPLAKRMSEQAGLDLSTISGSGPNGRIVKADIETAQSYPQQVSQPQTVTTQTPQTVAPSGNTPFVEEKLSNMRKKIAKRLTESKQSVPHFYLTVDAEIDKLLKLRSEMNSQMTDGKLSVNDFIIKACAMAIKKIPDANVQFGGDVLRRFNQSDISVAVAIEGGLVTPVIRSAELLGLGSISSEMKRLAGLARDGKLMPEDYTGGTFSISNLGMFGIREFSAVINPPQGAILAVGAGKKRAVIKDDALSIATVMTMTLSCDHRAIDGSVGATFLQVLTGFLENPLTMLI